MSSTRTAARTASVAIRAMLVFTLLLGVGYTLLVTGIGQLLLPWQANGSPVANGKGSALIGQSFTSTGLSTRTDSDVEALPEYFQSRPVSGGRRLRRQQFRRQQPGLRESRPDRRDRRANGTDRRA